MQQLALNFLATFSFTLLNINRHIYSYRRLLLMQFTLAWALYVALYSMILPFLTWRNTVIVIQN